jgi:hypothetical protein
MYAADEDMYKHKQAGGGEKRGPHARKRKRT